MVVAAVARHMAKRMIAAAVVAAANTRVARVIAAAALNVAGSMTEMELDLERWPKMVQGKGSL